MKGDLKGIDVGGDDIEEIGMEDEEDEDSQGQANGSNSSAKWDNYSFIFFFCYLEEALNLHIFNDQNNY